MTKVDDNKDARLNALEKWVSEQIGEQVTGEPASADASFRRYFRFQPTKGSRHSLIGMDAPPQQEDCRPFLDVTRRLGAAGVNVPEVIASDLEQGFLLLSDMGTQTWLHTINDDNAGEWFALALDELVRLQQADTSGLPVYDEALLRRELELFPQWYLFRHLGMRVTSDLRRQLDEVFGLLIDHAVSQPKVFVHRDFMPRNLMFSEPNPGVIDYQDAVFGPISYDPVCLFKDAFISWPEPRVQGWLELYWQKAASAGLPVPDEFADFQRDCDLMGVHRHLKVIGIFARICHRDGKPHYLEDVPRFFAYLQAVIARRPELEQLQQVLQSVQEQQEQNA